MNPFDGVKPDFGPFQGLIGSKVGVFLALVWAIAFVYVGYHLVVGVAKLARARAGGYGDDLARTREGLMMTVVSIVALAAVPVIYGVLINA
jgi:hypothetical protein